MAKIAARPYGGSPTSVKVKQVLKNNAGDITGLVYAVIGGQAPRIGMALDEAKLNNISVSNGAPLYVPPSSLPVSSFAGVGAATLNALEYSGNGATLKFTTSIGQKQIAYTDTDLYSGSLLKNVTFDKRFFDATVSLTDSSALDTTADISWNNTSTPRIILRKAKDLATRNYGDEVNPYSAKSPMLVLASAPTVFKITSVEPNYYDGFAATNGYIKYSFTSDGRLAFGNSAAYFSDGGISAVANSIASPTVPIIVTGVPYSAYNITNIIPTFVTITTSTSGSTGYFIVKVDPYATNKTALPTSSYPNGGYNPNTGILDPVTTPNAIGRIAPANMLQKRAPSFRRLNGDDVSLTLAPVISSSIQNILVTDSENVIKKLGLAPSTDYFLRGDNTWSLLPTTAFSSSTFGNTINVFTPDTTSGTRTLQIRPSFTTGRDGNLDLRADGNGLLSLTGGAGGATIIGGYSSATGVNPKTSITGVSNSGTDSSGPIYIDAGTPTGNAAKGNIYIGTTTTATSSVVIGENSLTSTELRGAVSATDTLSIPGELIFTSKGTTTPANPSTGQAKLYFKQGSTGGTLKLVVKFGSKETTILDNIASS